MVVIVLEKVPVPLRGHLTRWMLEVKAGVFVGRLSALVRDLLWEKCQAKAAGGHGVLMYRTNTEQGFILKMFGDSKRSVVDYDGLQGSGSIPHAFVENGTFFFIVICDK
jgi:CRISPR-associated protein Cas2